MLNHLRSALSTLFHGARFRRELDEEIAFHIERHTEDLIRSGVDPQEARRQARLRFGSVEEVKSRSREARGLALIDEALRNLRFALRVMARNPLFTVTFVLTLGLCVGAGTAVYSVVDAVLWRPLPYPNPDRLALVVTYNPATGVQPGYNAVDGASWERIRDGAELFERAVFSNWPAGVNLLAEDAAAYVQQQRVSAGFFRTLGVAPLIGREFEASEDVPGGPSVMVLSHGLWERTFNSDPEVVGRTIRLKGEAHTVVAVMPADFRSSFPVDVWTPLRPSRSGEGSGTNYKVLVRIPPGMSWAEADARIGGIEPVQPSRADAPERRFGLVPLNRALTWEMRQPLLLLLGAILVMLLVGCANLAGLQIARALARRTEIATRQALGGGTGAILRQILAENLTLGLLGGLAGLAVAYLGVGGLEALVRTHFDTWQTVQLDGRALAVAFGLTMLATLLFGLAPMLQVRKVDVRGVLVSGSRSVVGSGGHHLRKALLVGEVALVTALLFAAGLLVRSYGYLDRLDPGFDSDGVLTVQLSLDDARYASGAEVNRLFNETLDGLWRLPAVSSAAVALTLPYERPLNMPFKIVGVEDAPGTYRITNVVYVTPDFLQTLGIPLLRGRNLEAADRGDTPPVVVPNQAFVEANLADGPAIGARLTFGGREWEVVGVAGDVQQSNAGWGDSEPIWKSPTLYIPAAQAGDGFFRGIHIWFAPSWLVKTSGSPAGLTAAVTGVIHGVNPDMPVARITLLSDVMAGALARPRFQAVFLVVVAAFALLLALVGLYGIVANEVVERTSEMGLRMALGASPGRAVWTVGLPGLRLTLIGLVAGGSLTAITTPWLVSVIFGVVPYDPVTVAFAAVCLTVLAAAASFLPATRIARLQPARILREE
ncbi:MAG: ABC transporter permease [Gemmatimonadota bacterium]|nr:MAG: ABC transporter permease [Gemmatimonadota bacterium]